jgi:protein tyrosine phosphatase
LNEIKLLLSYMKIFSLLGVDKEYSSIKIVHCSAGIGRSGTLVACDQISKCGATNIPSLVGRIRRQRLGAVQTLSQYNFIYDFQEFLQPINGDACIAESHKRSRLVQSM